MLIFNANGIIIIESVDSISRDELDAPLTQYITNAGITRARYTITHFKYHHRVLLLIFNRKSVEHRYNSAIYVRTARSKKSQFCILFILSSSKRTKNILKK